jgi:competence protein ComEC
MKTFQFPLIRITLAFCFGIVCERILVPTAFQLITSTLLSAVALPALHFFSKRQVLPTWIFGTITFFLFFCFGIGVVRVHDVVLQPHHFSHKITAAQTLKATFRLEAPLRTSKKNYRYIGSLQSVNHLAVSGKVVVSFPKNKPRPKFNQTYAAIVWFRPLPNQPNPRQFDYGNYLKTKAIYGQINVKKYRCWTNPNPTLAQKILTFHDKIANRLANSLDAETAPLIMALILGQQQDINPSISKDYQLAGAVHILSVSGLHVGFLVLVFQFLLKPVPNTRKYRLFKMLLLVTSLWFFGCLAGLAPSVLRSVTMYSFVIVGQYLRRTVNIYNTLCISAFIILLFDPNALWDVGFQLSYLALFFIVWLQPIFKKMYAPKTKIGCYFWDLTTVSLAAQLGTFPLSLFYFHQFPCLFIITNWIILPPLTLVLLLGLLAVLMASFNGSLDLISSILLFTVKTLNSCIHWIAQQDQFTIQNIPMNIELMVGLYGVLFAIGSLFRNRNYTNLITVGFSIIGLQLICLTIDLDKNQSEFLVGYAPKKSVIIWKDNNRFYTNSDAAKSQPLIDYQVSKFYSVTKPNELPRKVFCKNRVIVIVDSLGIFPKRNEVILVLKNSPKCHLENWLEKHPPSFVVADGSSTKSLKKIWKQSCKKLKIPFHDTAEKGPFIIN